MANTSHESMVLRGCNFAIILPAVLTSGKISSVATAIKHEALESTSYELAALSSSDEVISFTLENGVTVEAPKTTKTISAVTGVEKAAGGAKDKITIVTAEADYAAMLELQGLMGDQLFIGIGTGYKSDGSIDGFAFIHGKISNALTHSAEADKVQTVSIEISGAEGVADTGFDHTDLNTAFTTTVEPMGADAALDILKASPTTNHFSAGDLTNLLSGKVVLKPIA